MRALRDHGLVIAALVGVVLSSWIVAGGGNLPLVEEWRLLAAYDRAGDYFSTGGAHQALHPLIGTFHLAAYLLAPDSLRGFPLVLASLLIAKALAAYALVLTLSRGDGMAAFLVAALLTAYPSDEGTFLFRTLNAHGAVLFAMTAVWAFARLWNDTTRSVRWLLLMCGMQLLSALTYDIAIPFFLAAPLLIWLIQPRRVPFRLLAYWYLVPAVVVANLLRAMLVKSTGVYEASVFAPGDRPLQQVLNGLGRAYAANLWTGWWHAWTAALGAPALTVLVAIVVGLVCWATMARLQRVSDGDITVGSDLRWLLVGLLIIAIGVSPYLVTIYWADTWRVFFLSSLGGAIVVAYACANLRHLRHGTSRLATVTAGALVLTIGVAHAGVQHRHTAILGEHARAFLVSIAQQVPALRRPAAIIVISREPVGDYQLGLFFGHGDLVEAVEYMYRDYRNVLGVHACQQDKSPRDPFARTGCEFGPARVDVFDTARRIGSYAYDQVVLFSYSQAGGYRLLSRLPDDFPGITRTVVYQPEVLIDRAAAVPGRARAIAMNVHDLDETKAAQLVAYSFESTADGWTAPGMLRFDRRSRPTVDGVMTMHAETTGVQMAHSATIELPDSPGPYSASAWVYVGKGAARFGIDTPAGRSLAAATAYAADRWVRLCVDTGTVAPRSLVRLYVDDYHLPSEFWLDLVSLSPGPCAP